MRLIIIRFINVGNVGYCMEPESDCLSPQYVKARLQEIIEAMKDNRDIDVSKDEIRELQHFFNERSTAFLQAARQGIKMLEARKRMRRYGLAVFGVAPRNNAKRRV